MFPKVFVWGEYAAVGRADAQAARDYFPSGRPESARTSARPQRRSSGVAGGWPTPGRPTPGEAEYSRVRPSNVETLLIGGSLDLSTPPQFATRELLPYLPNGHEVVLPGLGHTGSFWADQPEAGSRLINTFLDSGRVDDSLYKPQNVDFKPEFSAAAIAKGIAGTMVGLALLVVLSLLWMPRRVHKRGHFGRKSERHVAVALSDRPRPGRMVRSAS